MMKSLQRLGKALMLPIATLPVAGIMMGIGYLLAPAAMGAGGDAAGIAYTIGFLLIKAGGAIIDNIAWLFVIGTAVGLSDDHDGTAALAGLVSFLMVQQLLSPAVIGTVKGLDADAQAAWLLTSEGVAFSKVAGNVFIGLLCGIIGATCYNRFKGTRLPDWLAFFSGRRSVAIMTAFVSMLASLVLIFVWPVLFGALVMLGQTFVSLKGIGLGIYGFLNRLLIPTGLHHALNNVLWFDTIGLGDLTHYWAGDTSANVSWSLGMYMSGFFPCMMFGIPGAALAIYRAADNKKAVAGILVSAAACSFICGVTEPFEFAFMFVCFPLYVAYAALYGLFSMATYYLNFRAGFMFSGGAVDLLLSSPLPAAQNTWLIIPLGIAAFVLFYLVFYVGITKFNLPMIGRGDNAASDDDAERATDAPASASAADDRFVKIAKGVFAAVGGAENIESFDFCSTRLRFDLKDGSKVDDDACKRAGALAVIHMSPTTAQVVIGAQVQAVYEELKQLA